VPPLLLLSTQQEKQPRTSRHTPVAAAWRKQGKACLAGQRSKLGGEKRVEREKENNSNSHAKKRPILSADGTTPVTQPGATSLFQHDQLCAEAHAATAACCHAQGVCTYTDAVTLAG
jgi:hypothetical protein